jgi:hypothetical protein
MPPGGKIIELFPKGYPNWQQKRISEIFGHQLVGIESDRPGIYGRQPNDEMRAFLDKHQWPGSAKLQLLAISSLEAQRIVKNREFGRVLRDVSSFSIEPEKILKNVEAMLSSRESAAPSLRYRHK